MRSMFYKLKKKRKKKNKNKNNEYKRTGNPYRKYTGISLLFSWSILQMKLEQQLEIN